MSPGPPGLMNAVPIRCVGLAGQVADHREADRAPVRAIPVERHPDPGALQRLVGLITRGPRNRRAHLARGARAGREHGDATSGQGRGGDKHLAYGNHQRTPEVDESTRFYAGGRKRIANEAQSAPLARAGGRWDSSCVSATRISLLGRLSIDREDHAAAPRELSGRRAELVFAYLAAEHHRMVSRDELADALWPDLLPDTWAAALRGVVTEVRRFVEEAGLDPAEVLVATGGGYQLRLPDGVVVDLDEARDALAAAREELAARALPAAWRTPSAPPRWRGCRSCPSTRATGSTACAASSASLHVSALELQVRARAEAGDPRGAADRGRAARPGRAVQRGRASAADPRARRGRRPRRRHRCVRALPEGARRGARRRAVGGDRIRAPPGARARARRVPAPTAARRVLGAGRRGSRLPAPHRGAAAARARRRHDRGGRRRACGARAARRLGAAGRDRRATSTCRGWTASSSSATSPSGDLASAVIISSAARSEGGARRRGAHRGLRPARSSARSRSR